jgi:hypothetical protein
LLTQLDINMLKAAVVRSPNGLRAVAEAAVADATGFKYAGYKYPLFLNPAAYIYIQERIFKSRSVYLYAGAYATVSDCKRLKAAAVMTNMQHFAQSEILDINRVSGATGYQYAGYKNSHGISMSNLILKCRSWI